VFHAGRKAGGAGTAGYDPDMLLTVLVWAYAHEVTSSRRIERGGAASGASAPPSCHFAFAPAVAPTNGAHDQED
jgi:hypothetical protein